MCRSGCRACLAVTLGNSNLVISMSGFSGETVQIAKCSYSAVDTSEKTRRKKAAVIIEGEKLTTTKKPSLVILLLLLARGSQVQFCTRKRVKRDRRLQTDGFFFCLSSSFFVLVYSNFPLLYTSDCWLVKYLADVIFLPEANTFLGGDGICCLPCPGMLATRLDPTESFTI